MISTARLSTTSSPTTAVAVLAAGETSTTIASVLAGWYAAHIGVPGGQALLTGTVLWAIGAGITVAIIDNG